MQAPVRFPLFKDANSMIQSAQWLQYFTQLAVPVPNIGTTTNDNAAAGIVGEYKEDSVASSSAVPLTSDLTAPVASLSLSAGDWDVSGAVNFNMGTTTQYGVITAAISTSAAAMPSLPDSSAAAMIFPTLAVAGAIGTPNIITGMKRISLAMTTTVYLVTNDYFTTSTCAAFGTIRARRVR